MPGNLELSLLGDTELDELFQKVDAERKRRMRKASPCHKAGISRTNKRDLRCPDCQGKAVRDGRRGDGVQRYRCTKCGKRFSDTTSTGLSSSKLLPETIRKIVALILLDCPDWVISWIVGIDTKTAQFWRDRCLDSAKKWADSSKLGGHAYMDEMRFAPVRTDGPQFLKYNGHIARDVYMEVCFDCNGNGFCHVFPKQGTPTSASVLECLSGKVEKGTVLTHDGALFHRQAVSELGLKDDSCKAILGDGKYESRMKLMSNACSVIRYNFSKHKGIKLGKLEAYGDFFLYRWTHMRRNGLEETIDFMMGRVCSTKKSHTYRDSFRKASNW